MVCSSDRIEQAFHWSEKNNVAGCEGVPGHVIRCCNLNSEKLKPNNMNHINRRTK